MNISIKTILHVEYHMKGIKFVLYYFSETTVGFISLNGALILIFEQEKKTSLIFMEAIMAQKYWP